MYVKQNAVKNDGKVMIIRNAFQFILVFQVIELKVLSYSIKYEMAVGIFTLNWIEIFHHQIRPTTKNSNFHIFESQPNQC